MQNENSRHRSGENFSPPTSPSSRLTNRLKAERVRDELRQMPGWQSIRNGAVICRLFELFAKSPGALHPREIAELGTREGDR